MIMIIHQQFFFPVIGQITSHDTTYSSRRSPFSPLPSNEGLEISWGRGVGDSQKH